MGGTALEGGAFESQPVRQARIAATVTAARLRLLLAIVWHPFPGAAQRAVILRIDCTNVND